MTVKIRKTKEPDGTYTYSVRCDRCGASYLGQSYGWSADVPSGIKHTHSKCRMKRVCCFCGLVMDEGTDMAATTHGICDECAVKEARKLEEMESEDCDAE